ncbi:MAG: hypothetical protein U0984_11215, partial [Prosthecobacter sp.]|nr:hypothetical protein [Prosthecobacter sp.]
GNSSIADAYGWSELNGLGYQYFQRLPKLVEAITDKDIRRVAKTYFGKAKTFIVRVMPRDGAPASH